jgi:N-acetyl-gamma-glutamyl-phosphate reductase
VFGLPELAADQRTTAPRPRRIANPGCHSSGFILLMRPLVDAGLVPTSSYLTATSITGYSGGGRKMIDRYAAGGDALNAPMPYGLTLEHKHVPEMTVHSGLAVQPVFMPIVASFYKGLAVSVPLHLDQLGEDVTPERIHRVLAERYANERFVRVMPLRDPDALESAYFDVSL